MLYALLGISLQLCVLLSFVQQLEGLGGCYKLNPTGVTHYLSGGRLEYCTAILKFLRLFMWPFNFSIILHLV